jgi:hypothetical protein
MSMKMRDSAYTKPFPLIVSADVKAAVDRDKTKEPSVVFRGVKWHSETQGSGKNRRTERVETGSENRTMLIPGVTDVSDDIPEAEFRKYSLIKLTIIRSWEAGTGHRLRMLTLLLIKAHAHRPPLPCFICFLFLLLTIQPFAEEGSEDYFKEQRDRFKQEANTDSEFDYSEFFSLGDLPVHQLLKNNARPSCLLNKYAYGICILFLLAWPWKMYFELCTVQGTIRVRKELTRNGETQDNSDLPQKDDGVDKEDDLPPSYDQAGVADEDDGEEDLPPTYDEAVR